VDSKTIDYSGNGITAQVVVGAANVLMGMKRTRLRNEYKHTGDDAEEIVIARVFTYPDLIAAAHKIIIDEVEGVLTFDQFVALPEAFVIQWESAVYELNPHWLPQVDDEKKG